MWKFCGTAQFPQTFGPFTGNSTETAPFHKIFTSVNKMKFWCFMQWNLHYMLCLLLECLRISSMKCQLSEIHGAGRIERCLFITFLEALQYGVKINGNNRISRPEVFCKKGILKKYAKFTEKHLCSSLFFNKVAGLRQKNLQKVLSYMHNSVLNSPLKTPGWLTCLNGASLSFQRVTSFKNLFSNCSKIIGFPLKGLLSNLLTHFMPLVSFYTPRKHQ